MRRSPSAAALDGVAKRALGRGIDVLLLIPISVAALVLRAARRHGLPGRLPRTMAALDRIGVYPVLHQYYEPFMTAADLRQPLEHVRELPGVDLDVPGQLEFLEQLRYGDELLQLPDGPVASGQFTFSNSKFGPGDAELYYSLIRHVKPSRVIEVGSGHSSLIAALAIAANRTADTTYRCAHQCIEPFENPWLDSAVSHVIRCPVERLDISFFDDLRADDILFIDSTHVIRPQGDVLFEFLSVLGRLPTGVYVHVHDVFTPRDYPSSWVLTERRMWNEQYLLEALLCHSDRFQVIAALNHLWREHPQAVSAAFPVIGRREAEPGSFWLRVR
jgi:hypothetical protein